MISTQAVPNEIDRKSERSNGAGHLAPDGALLRELEALRRSEAVLRDFIETSTISLHWVGADGTILWANQAELDLLGYARDQYVGRNITDFHADRPVIEDILGCLSRGETLRDYPARLRHRDGSIRHVLINSSVLFEDGKFVHTRCFTRDVTALRHEQDTREEQRRLDAFVARIGKQLIENADLGDMLRNCAETIISQVGAALARIWTFDDTRNVLKLHASEGIDNRPRENETEVPIGCDITGRIASERKPRLFNETVSELELSEQSWLKNECAKAFAGYPLVVEDRLVGVMEVFGRDAISDAMLQTLSQIADQIAAGVERKKVEEALRESEARLAAELEDTRLVQDISAQLIEQGDEDALCAKLVDAVARIMRSDFATMQMLYPERGPRGELRLLASRGLNEQSKKVWEWVRLDTESTCGQALRTGKRAIAADIETCDFLAGTGGMAALLDAGIRAAQSTPLYSRTGTLLGMISSHWREPHTPTDRDLRMLDILARQAADLIERKKAEQALRESERRLHEIVEAIPAAVYTTDAQGRITFFNKAAVEFSGRVPELGTDSWCVTWKLYNTDGTPLPHDRCPMAVALKEQRPVLGCEAVAERPDGERRTFMPYPTPLFDEGGRLTGAVNMLVDITERRKAEEMRRLLGAIVDSSDDAIISKDMEGHITSWNHGAERLYGYTAGEAIGKSIYIVVPPDRHDEELEILERLRRDEPVDHFETIRRRKDGTLLNVSLTISPVKNQSGEIIGASKIARDITEQKRAEEAIRMLNARLTEDLDAMSRLQQLSTRLIHTGGIPELLGEILDAGIQITAADMGNIQLLDDGGRLRIVAQRGFDAPFLEFFDNVHGGLAACGTAMERGERVVIEDITRSPVFQATPALHAMLAADARAVQSTPLVSRSGKILGMFSTHYRRPQRPSERELRLLDLLARQAADLIERRRGEEGRSQLSAIVEASGDAIYSYDLNGRLVSWNRAAEELYGYRGEEIIGQAADMIVPPEKREELRNVLQSAGESGNIIRNLETMRMRRGGNVFPAVLTISPIRDENGKTAALSVIARDISERKRVENELRRANQDLEQFAYSASHDLQEPLRTIKIYSQLLANSLSTAVEGETAEFLDFLRSAATRMELLVRDLLAYTQVTRLDAPLEVIDANEAVSEVIENLRGAISESGAIVTFDSLPSVRVHRTHMRQLFQNLVGNAIKYRSEDRAPAVHIAAERQDRHWVFTVRDNGIGIQPEFKEQIFGLFSRLHNSDRYSGTGIGLAICQRIVERYHGRIWVESEPGCGSEFRFTLPV